MEKQSTKPKTTEKDQVVKSSNKSRKTKKTSGSRWAALILLAITVILSIIFKLQSNFSKPNQSQPSESTGKTWQFTIKDSN